MPRALAIRHLDVEEDGRAPYLARLAERVASAKAAGFHLWVFEAEGTRGRFVEFIEAAGAQALQTALLHDTLLAETLDFRHPPPPDGEWHRYTGIADQ